jgi:hypothetical protein
MIKESTLNCPSKRLRRRLWAVLDGYHWRRSRLVSRYRVRLLNIFCPFSDSSTLQKYTNFIYNLYLVQLNHIRDSFDILYFFLNLYTSYTNKISTLSWSGPWVIGGGGFNVIRNKREKIGFLLYINNMQHFNVWIENIFWLEVGGVLKWYV